MGGGWSPSSISALCSGESAPQLRACIWCHSVGRGSELPLVMGRYGSSARTVWANSRKADRTMAWVISSSAVRVRGVPSSGATGGRCSAALGRSAARLYSLPNSQAHSAGERWYRATTSRVYRRMKARVRLSATPHRLHGSRTRSGTVDSFQTRLGISPTPVRSAARTTPSSRRKYSAGSLR